MSNTSDMVDVFIGINGETTALVSECKAKISVLDQAKGPYVRAAKNLDRNLHDQITTVNNTLYATRDAYDERIDDQGCRTDLFWRLTGITSSQNGQNRGPDIYTFTCTKLATVYEKSNLSGITSATQGAAGSGSTSGFSTNTVTYYDGSTFNKYELPEEGDSLNGVGSGLDSFYAPENLHGLKLYNEPYARDMIDTFRASGIGIVSTGTDAATNRVTILSPANETPIKAGQLMTPSKSGFFATQYVTVTGVGTTSVDLSTYPFSGITTSQLINVPYITVDALPVGIISAPQPDGTYVTMTFTQDPSTIGDDFAIERERNPYVDQSIELMDPSQVGTGVKIVYDNSGISSGTRAWNKFMEGQSDPNVDLDDDGNDTLIVEPPLGADKIFYRIGFTNKPILYPGSDDAEEGDTIQVSETLLGIGIGAGFATLYEALPTCDDTTLNEAISARNTAESALASDSDFPKKISLSNAIKDKINEEFNLRTWAYRTQIGQAQDRKAGIDTFRNLINTSNFSDLMNS